MLLEFLRKLLGNHSGAANFLTISLQFYLRIICQSHQSSKYTLRSQYNFTIPLPFVKILNFLTNVRISLSSPCKYGPKSSQSVRIY